MATVAAAVDAKQEYKIIMVLGFKDSSNFVDTDIIYSPQYEIQSCEVFEINLLNTENRAKIHNTITIDFYYCEKNSAPDEKQSESYSNRPRNYRGHLQIKRGSIISLEDTSTGKMNKIDDQHKHKVASSQFHFPKIFKTAEIIFAAAEDHRQTLLKVNP
ncbi:MAG: hypothetical protein M1561_00305, partial [Gammaproteobacteria bacterium]|nr:hypothetical protein [Gammaproteobacteria bacterium]